MKPIILYTILLFSLYGCSKKESNSVTPGPAPAPAQYQSKVIFWYDFGFYQSNMWTTLQVNLYVDGSLVGSPLLKNKYLTASPPCDSAGFFNFTKDLGTSTSKIVSVYYQCLNVNGIKTFESTPVSATINSGCTTLQLKQ